MKLRKINDIHFVITDSNPTTNGDYAIHPITLNFSQHHSKDNNLSEGWEKIEFSTQPLDTIILKNKDHSQSVGHYYGNGGQLSLQEVKELIGEVDVEKKAINSWEGCDSCDTNDELFFINGYQKGYNQAFEDNKDKKYTEEDMRKAWNAAYIDAMSIDEETYKPLFFEDFIQSFHPKTEWEYVGECKGNNGDGCFMDSPGHNCSCYKKVPKTEWEVEFVNGKIKLK